VGLREVLSGGDRRSLGRAAEALARVRAEPGRFDELVELLWDTDAVVRMRAADCVEKLTLEPGFTLGRWKAELLGLMAETPQAELRWHLALMVARLPLSAAEVRRAAAVLEGYLDDSHAIVKVCAMQGLWELSWREEGLRAVVADRVRELARSGTAAMRARGRKLLAADRQDAGRQRRIRATNHDGAGVWVRFQARCR